MAKKIKRLINITDLIEAINDELYMDESTKAAFRSIVYQRPLIDAVPVVHGRWIDMGDFQSCSICKATRLKEIGTPYGKATWVKTKFCPDCGAKMDGGASDG